MIHYSSVTNVCAAAPPSCQAMVWVILVNILFAILALSPIIDIHTLSLNPKPSFRAIDF